MDTSLYRPDELKVNVMNDTLTVDAKHTEQSDDGRNFISRYDFTKKVTDNNFGHKHKIKNSIKKFDILKQIVNFEVKIT